jgi:hypothetical protein
MLKEGSSPQRWWGSRAGQFQLDGRPTAQWSRIRAGHDDDLGTSSDDHHQLHRH